MFGEMFGNETQNNQNDEYQVNILRKTIHYIMKQQNSINIIRSRINEINNKLFRDLIINITNNVIKESKYTDKVKKIFMDWNFSITCEQLANKCYIEMDNEKIKEIIKPLLNNALESYYKNTDFNYVYSVENIDEFRNNYDEDSNFIYSDSACDEAFKYYLSIISDIVTNILKENVLLDFKIRKDEINSTITSELNNKLMRISSAPSDSPLNLPSYEKFHRDYTLPIVVPAGNHINIVKRSIEIDDPTDIAQLSNVKFSWNVFTMCSLCLATKCFDYFYSLLTDKELEMEKKFYRECYSSAVNGNNFDGRPLYKITTQAKLETKKPETYTSPRRSIIPEDIFYCAFTAPINNPSKYTMNLAVKYVSHIMKNYSIGLGDFAHYQINMDKSIQGYNSMVSRYMGRSL